SSEGVSRGCMAANRRKSRKQNRSGAARPLGVVVLFALIVAGAAAWLALTPYGPSTETLVNLTPGSSSARIGRELQQAGVVRSRFAFGLVRLVKRGTLKAGVYRFDHPASVPEVYSRIERGDVYTVAVTIPEGANIFDIGARLQQAGIGTRRQFLLAAVEDVGLIKDVDPQAKSLEGYLFPDTYRFSPNATDTQVVQTMVRRFRTAAGKLGLSGDLHRVVTVASLVERETALPAERPLVASVFENRLAKNMPLMSDPSVIYGLELDGHWRGAIYQSDLTFNTAYNTYLHAGLPPGPVANPGLQSLRAAMSPPKTDFLYFVAAGANPQGGSLFSSTLEQHHRDVAGYRKAVKQAGGR
ncbi:MAG TPA: endolytic transglycosylase MltG, partial [Candidatus Angelobacter sp.]|nr:endolytic transglycosylase MltG [Candidatus Angelobacter sp.]